MTVDMKKPLLALLGLAALGLAGCQNTYPPEMKYGVRTDPLLKPDAPAKFGDERYEPDPPGRLPILRASEIENPESPYYPKRENLLKEGLLINPLLMSADARQKLGQVLEELFGTPAAPKVGGIDDAARDLLKLDDATLAKGSELYRIHCVHCHGVPGDGRGPTARWINPHPRDFRAGKFKFQSVDQTSQPNRPPARADLIRTLRNGIEGTAMPSFLILPPEQLEQLASYVIHLSMRGRAEFDSVLNTFEYDPAKQTLTPPEDVGETVRAYHGLNAKAWVASQDPKSAIQPAPYDYKFNKKDPKNADGGEWQVWKNIKSDAEKAVISANIAQAMFNGEEPTQPEAKAILKLRGEAPKDVNCRSCHTDYGRQAKYRFDEWGTLVQPRNLTLGVFRGGRRPVDLYYRIHSGINGSGMNIFGKTISNNTIWDLVNFAQAMTYPGMRNRLEIRLDVVKAAPAPPPVNP
jgi:mono/diheme cytochrome c family protein